MILFQHYFVVCLNAVAILALEHYVVAVDDIETRLHGLVVGDALGVFAFHYVGELVGQRHGVLVNHIENRSHTGWCPLETACRCCATAEECLVAIKAFVAAMKGKK